MMPVISLAEKTGPDKDYYNIVKRMSSCCNSKTTNGIKKSKINPRHRPEHKFRPVEGVH